MPVSTDSQPGLIFVQIDGLAHSQFDEAMKCGRLPFIKKLIENEHYKIHSLYSGLPSSTPSVQAELFYGVRNAVPAFGFIHRPTNKTYVMANADAAKEIERELSEAGEALLKDGSSYSNVYTGGAARANFCATRMGFGNTLKKLNPVVFSVLLMMYGFVLLRFAVLFVIEFVLAIIDLFRGLIAKENFFKEVNFISARVGLCVLLRELVTENVKLDTTCGRPIIHCNFLGYDEQAHRRGPSSRFAHWTLRGIDDCVRRIHNAAQDSGHRDYDLWIYSDHGQETTESYTEKYKYTIHEAVNNVLEKMKMPLYDSEQKQESIQLRRIMLLGGKWIRHYFNQVFPALTPDDPVQVIAVGPIGLVYFPEKLQRQDIARIGPKLVSEAHVPLVMAADGPGKIVAWNENGEFSLPDDLPEVIGAEHPFLEELGKDLLSLVHHPDSGTLVLSGWQPGKPPISFPIENGGHAGPGYDETRGFALLPDDAPIPVSIKEYIRPLELRSAALHFKNGQKVTRTRPKSREKNRIRILSYNVHSCIGLDGKHKLERIARAIALYNPDIVALQELDYGRERTGGVHQARTIAEILDMEYHFHPAMVIEEEQYGNAILSRLPMKIIKTGNLPGIPNAEPRGALWVEAAINGLDVQLITTHLGLKQAERLLQVQALLGSEWFGNQRCGSPCILCGDFNMLYNSAPYRRIIKGFRDTARTAETISFAKTYMGIVRIDYVFVTHDVRTIQVYVPRSNLTRIASDHYPLIADIVLPSDNVSENGKRKNHSKVLMQ